MPHKHAMVLLGLIAAAVFAGGLSGWLWGPAMEGIAWMGELFLNALRMLIVPLILAAVISSVAALGIFASWDVSEAQPSAITC